MSRYIPLMIFGIIIIAAVIVFIYFKVKWGMSDRAEKRGHAEKIEREKDAERKQQNQS
jgi:uncharacterized membrane protein